MSKIDDLIHEFCPNGVDCKTLGEVCIIKTGQSVSKLLISKYPGEYPVINSGREPLGFIDKYNTEDDPIGITSRGAGVGSVTWCPEKYYRGNLNYSVTIRDKHFLDVRFLYYLLMQNQPGIQQLATYQGIPALNKSNLEQLPITIPPLVVQKEIVSILDKFTQLEAELSAELDTRRKQYEYYRNQLLTFDQSISVKQLTLGDLGRIVTGRTPKSSESDYWGNDMLFVTPSDIMTGSKSISTAARQLSEKGTSAMKSNVIPAKSILVTCIGSDMGKTIVNDRECVTNQQINSIILDDCVSPDYIYHLLASKTSYLKALGAANGSTMPIINKSLFSKIEIELPPFEMQLEIAKLLDKFDLLVNDLQQGLPAEIEARHKQYEYYRAKLLTFQEVSA